MSDDLQFRPARPEDKDQMMAISAQIWEGGDYIPYVWDYWLADPRGQFGVALLDGRIVGCGKLTRLGPREWWLEGLRMDPAYRGRGIGGRVHEHFVQVADEVGSGVLRFSTSSANTSVHRFAESTGFTRIGNYTFYDGQPLADGATAGAFTRLAPGDVDRAERFLKTSDRLKAAHGLFERRWQWLQLTRSRLSEAARSGRLLSWRDLAGLVLVMPRVLRNREPRLRIGYADAPGEQLADLACDLRALAANRGLPSVDWKVPDRPDVTGALEKAGYERDWEHTLFIYQRPIGSGGNHR